MTSVAQLGSVHSAAPFGTLAKGSQGATTADAGPARDPAPTVGSTACAVACHSPREKRSLAQLARAVRAEGR